MNCKNCNSSIENGVRFCPQCGASVADSFSSLAASPFGIDFPASVDFPVSVETSTSKIETDTTPDEAAIVADAGAEQKAEPEQSTESVPADVRIRRKSKVSIPKFVTRHYIKRTALFSSLVAVSILVVTLCLTFSHSVNNPVTFSTYQELERISQRSGRHAVMPSTNMQSFRLGTHVERFDPSRIVHVQSLTTVQDIRTVNYIDFQGNYVLVNNSNRRSTTRDSDLVLLVDTTYIGQYNREINRRIEVLRNASSAERSRLAELSGDALERTEAYIARIESEIESLQNISDNLSPIRLTVFSRESRLSFPRAAGWSFAILLVIAIFPAMTTWVFFIAPSKSAVYRYLAVFGDANTLFEECEKSFGATTLLNPNRVEISREFIVLFKLFYVFIAPVSAARYGNLDITASSGRGLGPNYSFRLNLSFSHGIEECIRVKHETDGTNALSYLKRLNPEFTARTQRLM